MTDIFNGVDQTPVAPEPVVTLQQTPVIPPELSEYVGAGKKYATIDEVHKAFPNAQKHISTLEEENRVIKEELAKRRTAEELLNDIQSRVTPQSNGDTIPAKVDIPDISSLVRQEVERVKIEESYKLNQKTVVDELTKVYGDKARDKYATLATELGVTTEALNQLALTSPTAFFKLAGITPQSATKSGTLSSDVIKVTNQNPDTSSSRVSLNGNAKDDAAAIARAREFVMKNLQS